MEITQKVIDVAMTKLPRRPEGISHAAKIAVCGNDIGINNGEVVVVDFYWQPEWEKWACANTPTEVFNVGRSVKQETVINTEHCFIESKPALNVVELKPKDSQAVLARIETITSLGHSTYHEVVYFDDEAEVWKSYAGSKTFEDGEKVVAWQYVKDIELNNGV